VIPDTPGVFPKLLVSPYDLVRVRLEQIANTGYIVNRSGGHSPVRVETFTSGFESPASCKIRLEYFEDLVSRIDTYFFQVYFDILESSDSPTETVLYIKILCDALGWQVSSLAQA
jgi:hypothetical protein